MVNKRLVIDVSTGEQYEEDLSPEENAQLEKDFAKAAEEKVAEEAKIEARKLLLEKLGITEDEAKLLLS